MKVIIQHKGTDEKAGFSDVGEFKSSKDALAFLRRGEDLEVGDYRIVSVAREGIKVGAPQTITKVSVDLGEPLVKRTRKPKAAASGD